MDDQYLWGFHFPDDHGLTHRATYTPSNRSATRSTSASPSSTSVYPQDKNRVASSAKSMSGNGSVAESLAQVSLEGSGESSSSKSPLNMGLGFLKNLTEKKTTRDGQTPKRRGPKPDAKPAMTRRQELNRQAQRTHRERKELYIKALEQEVTRLKETAAESTRERNAYKEENRQLRELLRNHNISMPSNGLQNYTNLSAANTEAYGGSSSGSFSGSYPSGAMSHEQGFRTPPGLNPGYGHPPVPPPPGQGGTGNLQRPRVDHDEVGIDFVLSLERTCMDHMPFLMKRSYNSQEDIHGHALMASCPREQDILDAQDVPEACPTSNIQKADLRFLMESCSRLQLDGEIPPVMAWSMIWGHPRLDEFTSRDFNILKDDLKMKVRCYGFGAVLEEFEVRDALSNVLATKMESYLVYQ